MNLTITHQESYSRGHLLLRSFFGMIYMGIPHLFMIIFASLWGAIITFIAWWAILFTGKYPRSFFDFQVGLNKWIVRLNARLLNLSDGYPSFGTSGQDDKTNLEIPYPESLSRGVLLLKTFLGFFYVIIPHAFCLMFRGIATYFLLFLGWWAILITGKLPASWHAFIVGTIRWQLRLSLYINLLTDTYPKFSGKE